MQVALMDMEFEKLKDVLPNSTVSTMAVREHAGQIEKNTSNQGESKRDDDYPPLPYLAQAHDNQVDAFLCLVATLFPS